MRIITILFSLLLLSSFAFAFEIREYLDKPDEFIGYQVPSTLFANKVINANLKDADKEYFYQIVMSEKVDEIYTKNVERHDLTIYANLDTINIIANSENQLASLTKALNNKEITYKTESYTTSFLIGAYLFLSNWWF